MVLAGDRFGGSRISGRHRVECQTRRSEDLLGNLDAVRYALAQTTRKIIGKRKRESPKKQECLERFFSCLLRVETEVKVDSRRDQTGPAQIPPLRDSAIHADRPAPIAPEDHAAAA